MAHMRALAALFLSLSLVACSSGSDARAPDIQLAIDRLISHPGRNKRFVVVDHLATEKFVQFDFENDEVVVDLPVPALTKDELERASALFASVGIGGPTVMTDEENADTGEPMTITTFRLGFGNDSARASAFAGRVLHEVYLLPPDAKLSVTEDE